MNKVLLFILFIIIICIDAKAQIAPDFASVNIKPSENAATLYELNQVSNNHYNGSPNFQIPLFTLQGKDLSYPLNLSYSSNGVILENMPSWVGEGWEFNATGSISRNIRGYSDFKAKNSEDAVGGYFGCVSNKKLVEVIYPDPTKETTNWSVKFMGDPNYYSNDHFPYEIAYPETKIIDTEHDVFDYNVPGNINGSFIINEKGKDIPCDVPFENKKPEISFFNERDINITYHPICDDDDFWKVYDLAGNEYYFGKNSDNLIEWSSTLGNDYYKVDAGLEQATKWFLKSITSPQGEKIEFTYVDHNYSPITIAQTTIKYTGYIDGSISHPSPQVYKSKLLESIRLLKTNGDYTKVEFNYTDNLNTRNLKQLNNISISYHNASNQSIELFDNINFEYLQGVNRLFLRKITNNSGNLNYSFDYYSPASVPNHNSKAIDYWGYYNGKDNNLSKLPVFEECFFINGEFIYYYWSESQQKRFVPHNRWANPGDRKPNHSKSYYGLLNKIEYPTGGATEIEYEPNQWTNAQGQNGLISFNQFTTTDNWVSYEKEAEVCDAGSSFSCGLTNSATFYIEYSRQVELRYEIKASSSPSNFYRVFIEDANGNEIPGLNWYGTTNGLKIITFQLNEGQYKLKSVGKQNQLDPSFAKATLFGKFNVSKSQTGGAGNRVKSLSLIDTDGTIQKRTYNYYDGILYKAPYNAVTSPVFRPGATGIDAKVVQTIISTFFSINDPGLGNVGYGKVEEYIGEIDSNQGKTTFEFYNDPLASALTASVASEGYIVFYPFLSKKFNGRLKSKQVDRYSGGYKPIEKEEFTYLSSNGKLIFGSKLKNVVECSYMPPYQQANYIIANNSFIYGLYQELIDIVRPYTTKKISYSNDNKSYSTTITYNEYQNAYLNLPTKITITDPEKSTINWKQYAYINGRASSLIQQDELVISSNLIKGERVEYFSGKNKPQYYKTADLENPIVRNSSTMSIVASTKMESKYSGSDLIELIERGDKAKSFVYNSRDNGPIAIIENAKAGQSYYNGFEVDGTISTGARTGTKLHNSGTLNIASLFSPPNDGEIYYMSYWYWASSKWNFSGIIPYSTTTTNGTKIDDLRIFPKNSKMISFTYNFRGNATSITDPDNIITFYEYDANGRIIKILDQDGNILKKFEYHLRSN